MYRNNRGHKSFKSKILPASDCAPKIFAQFPATTMIPIDQGGGGYTPKTTEIQSQRRWPDQNIRSRNPQTASVAVTPLSASRGSRS
jgi:hypothetical protein